MSAPTPKLSYRVRERFAPGTELVGNHVVATPEAFIIRQAMAAFEEREIAKVRSHDWSLAHGRLMGLLDALAAVQAGSDYFAGDEPRKLEYAIAEAVAAR